MTSSTQNTQRPPIRRKLWIAAIVAVCSLLTCCFGAAALGAMTGRHPAPKPATVAASPSSSPSDSAAASPYPSDPPPSAPPPAAVPQTVPPTAAHVPAPARTTSRPNPPATQPAPGPVQGIHPGAFCSQHGQYGYSSTGKRYVCSMTPQDPYYRWRAA